MERWQKEISALGSSSSSLLKLLRDGLQHFALVLTREYAAICEHNIGKLESIALEKIKAGEQLQTFFASLAKNCATFSRIHYEATATSVGDHQSLSSLGVMIERLLPAGDLRRELGLLIAECQERFLAIKPEIEKNRLVMQELLFNHQQSYHFWQTTVKEASSSYDRSGIQRAPKIISQFHTKV